MDFRGKRKKVVSRLRKNLQIESGVEYVSNPYSGEIEDKKEDEINWDKISLSVQNTPRDSNKSDAEIVIDHEIYCDYYDSQIGYMHFSEFHNVIAKNIHPSLPKKQYDKLLYINNVLVNEEYRGHGIGKRLYEQFGELYKEQFSDYDVAQVFANPIAEYIFKEEMENGNIPENAYNEELVARQYDEQERELAKELFNWLPNDKQESFKKRMKERGL